MRSAQQRRLVYARPRPPARPQRAPVVLAHRRLRVGVCGRATRWEQPERLTLTRVTLRMCSFDSAIRLVQANMRLGSLGRRYSSVEAVRRFSQHRARFLDRCPARTVARYQCTANTTEHCRRWNRRAASASGGMCRLCSGAVHPKEALAAHLRFGARIGRWVCLCRILHWAVLPLR